MKNFLKTLLAVLLGNALFFGLIILLGIGVAVGAAMKSSKTPEITGNKILRLDIKSGLSDLSQNRDIKFRFNKSQEIDQASIYEIIDGIHKAKADGDIKGLWIAMNYNTSLSYAQLDLLRNAIQDFKLSKKPVVAYGETVSQKMYYLATIADKVYINPNGGMDLRGFGAQITFFKKALDKLEIQPQIFYAGKFKSATEPFRLEKMSEENKVQTKELLQDVSDNVFQKIAQDRKMSIDEIQSSINEMRSNLPSDAYASRFIDGAKYVDEVESELKRLIHAKEEEELRYTSLEQYLESELSLPKTSDIAVYVAEGDIVDGKAGEGSIGSQNMVKAIREMKDDESIKAVVLRVNSPGGSALASAVILREIELLKKKKPVVVSMGNVAASGGYYIAAYGNKIFAEPNTITGSIGVFGIIPNIGNLMQNKLGVTFDEVELNEHAIVSLNKGLDATEANKIQMEIDHIYQEFKTVVSRGRNLNIDSVESIAQGRVWSGEKAKSIHLVDEIGGLKEAIQYTSGLVKTDADNYFFFNKRKSEFEQLMEDFSGEAVSRYVKNLWTESILGSYKHYFKAIESFQSIRGAQTRMIYQIEIL